MSVQLPNAHFRVAPWRLRAVVKELGKEAPGAEAPKPASLRQLEQRLRALPTAELVARLTRREERLLPHLAVEIDDDLRQRLAHLAAGVAPRMRWRTAVRLVAQLPARPFCRALADRMDERPPPTGSVPLWLTSWGHEVLRAGKPARALAREVIRLDTGLSEMAAAVGLEVPSALATGVFTEILRAADDGWIHRQPFTPTLRLLESRRFGREFSVAGLGRLFELYGSRVSSERGYRARQLAEGQPVQQLLLVAREVMGAWPDERREAWADLPRVAKALAGIYRTQKNVEDFFGSIAGDPDRLRYWTGWAAEIKEFRLLKVRSGTPAFMMRIGDRFFVEFGESGNACYAYSETDWHRVARRRTAIRPDHLKMRSYTRGDHWLTHQGGWQRKFNEYIRRWCHV